VRDSAGVRIAESLRPAWTPDKKWVVAQEPSLTVGRTEGEEYEVLSSVTGAIRLSDGSIAVADGGARRVRLFDRAGRHLGSYGGAGQGPGEFDVLGLIGRWRGDSIGVWDSRLRRVTVFSRTGTARTLPPAVVEGMAAPAAGWMEDGSLIVTPLITFAEALNARPGEARRKTRFIRVRPDGRVVTALVLRGREVVVKRSGRSYYPDPVLFGRSSYLATSASGYVAGENDTFELRRYTSDGQLVTIIRKPGAPRPVTAGELRIAREEAEQARQNGLRAAARAASGGSVTALARPADLISDSPHRATHPYFDGLIVDGAECVWVREPAVGSATRSWLVFDPSGIWLGSVTIPDRLRITEIGRDYVLGVFHDELDVQTVRLYRLDRRT